jgi:alanine racemase
MDQLAVILPDNLRVSTGDEVTLVGRGAPIEALARAAGTIGYEIACALRHRPDRGAREVAA